jgi:hypothetical protein
VIDPVILSKNNQYSITGGKPENNQRYQPYGKKQNRIQSPLSASAKEDSQRQVNLPLLAALTSNLISIESKHFFLDKCQQM